MSSEFIGRLGKNVVLFRVTIISQGLGIGKVLASKI